MSHLQFGSGNLWAVPTIGLDGAAIVTPTPIPFGAIQEGSIEITGSLKELYGQYQYPIDVASGSKKITGKAKAAKITAALFNLAYGATVATGEVKVAFEEAGTVPGSSSYVITVTHSAFFGIDLGAKYALTGLPLKRVSGAPGTGEYSVAAGIYTFAVGDKSLGMKISYTYTASALPGQVLTINNTLMGVAINFKAVLNFQYKAKQMTLTLNRCVSNKLSFGTKTEDYTIPELDFQAMADDSDVIGTISFAEGYA